MLTRTKLLLCLSTLIILAAGAAARWFHDWPVRKFAVVEEGVLYRSAQPDEAGWKRLRDRYRIRTVIDLREDLPNEPWAVLERQFCAQNGIRHVRLPVGRERLTDEELRIVIDTIRDPACRPVLVHCELGKARTGVVIAAYRIVAQGWTYEAALAEAQRYKKNFEAGYAACLKEFAHARQRPSAAAPIGLHAPEGYPQEPSLR